MENKRKQLLVSCDSPRSLLDFRGKLMEELLKKYEVSVFTPVIDQPGIRYKLIHMGVMIYENELNPGTVSVLSDLRYIVRLWRVMKYLRPDVFFPYTFKPVIYGVLVAKFCKIEAVVPMLTGLGYNFSEPQKKGTWVQQVTRTLLKFSLKHTEQLRIIFQNADDYRTLLQAKIITKKNQAYLVNGSGVDMSYYSYSKPDIKNVSFLMIARLINAKGIREYYEAAKLLQHKFPGLTFKLIGAYEENIDAIDVELYHQIISDGVLQYHGLVEDVRSYISESSVVVLPSYYGEGVPRCLLEAMAMGRAIITSDSVGCRETVNPRKGGINGFLIPVKNVDELLSRMEYFLSHRNHITKFGINSRKYAEEKFDVNKVNEDMVRILDGSQAIS